MKPESSNSLKPSGKKITAAEISAEIDIIFQSQDLLDKVKELFLLDTAICKELEERNRAPWEGDGGTLPTSPK